MKMVILSYIFVCRKAELLTNCNEIKSKRCVATGRVFRPGGNSAKTSIDLCFAFMSFGLFRI